MGRRAAFMAMAVRREPLPRRAARVGRMLTNRSAPHARIVPVLTVRDVRAAVAWYGEVLEFAEHVRIGESHRAQLGLAAGGARRKAESSPRSGQWWPPCRPPTARTQVRLKVDENAAAVLARGRAMKGAHGDPARCAGWEYGERQAKAFYRSVRSRSGCLRRRFVGSRPRSSGARARRSVCAERGRCVGPSHDRWVCSGDTVELQRSSATGPDICARPSQRVRPTKTRVAFRADDLRLRSRDGTSIDPAIGHHNSGSACVRARAPPGPRAGTPPTDRWPSSCARFANWRPGGRCRNRKDSVWALERWK